jgi:uncharacterized glyoxalase superfamily protein PhnB
MSLEDAINFYESHFNEEDLEKIREEAIKKTNQSFFERNSLYVEVLVEAYKTLLEDKYSAWKKENNISNDFFYDKN